MPRPQNIPPPTRIAPQLVTLAATPPPGDWRYENKLDGYRMLTRIDHGAVSIFTRNGHDWTSRLPTLAREFAALPLASAWLDGEVVAQDGEGRPVFHLVQAAFSSGSTEALTYFAFDLMYLNGADLRREPLERRRGRLRQLIEPTAQPHIRFSASFDANPRDLLASVCAMKMEGIVGKRAGSAYTSKRSGDWVKLKCSNRQEFIIVGFTRAGSEIGSLLIGLHDDDGRLLYAGRVQSGLDRRARVRLLHRLLPLALPEASASLPAIRKGLSINWVRPELVCEVRFAEITPKGRVRHAVFVALREGMAAESVSLESSTPAEPPDPKA